MGSNQHYAPFPPPQSSFIFTHHQEFCLPQFPFWLSDQPHPLNVSHQVDFIFYSLSLDRSIYFHGCSHYSVHFFEVPKPDLPLEFYAYLFMHLPGSSPVYSKGIFIPTRWIWIHYLLQNMFLFLCLTSTIHSSVLETWLSALFLHTSQSLFNQYQDLSIWLPITPLPSPHSHSLTSVYPYFITGLYWCNHFFFIWQVEP